MNLKTLEKERRRCRIGLWNAKKDLYARRRTNYQCVEGKFILPKTKKIVEQPEPEIKQAEPKKKNWLLNWLLKLWKKLWKKVKRGFAT